jgi:MFS family permease
VYQAENARVLLDRENARAALGGTRVGRTVVLLGITSLFTDLSAEMVATVLPLYLLYGVGLSPLQFGLIDGLQNGAAGLVRLVGGGLGDRLRRHKEVAAIGYGLSAFTRPLFLLVGSSFAAIGALVFVDRIGKGIRTAPRDALISLSVPKERLGVAFGVHRALDTLGAMLGPLVAFAILSTSDDAFNSVFVVSFAAALVGLLVIVLLVEPDRRERSERRLTRQDAVALVRLPRFRALTLAGTALAVTTISDAFVYVQLQYALDFDFRYLPLFYVATAGVFMLLAVPVGALADRIGRGRVFVGGYVLLLAVYGLLLFPQGTLTVVLLAPLFGAYYAATDGVLAAASTEVLSEHTRGTGLALIATCTNLGRFAGSIAFGALWVAIGASGAVAVFAVGLAIAAAVAASLLYVTKLAHV